jgi:hypothetical protein
VLHVFTVDVVARMRVVTTIEDPSLYGKILTYLRLRTEVAAPRPPPSDMFAYG